MATGKSRSAAALARAEAHLAQARLAGKGRQNRLQPPPETTTPLLDGQSLERPSESSPTSEASPLPSGAGSGNLVQSLDELFSASDDAPSDTSSGPDFRANVLSLDDLAPVAASKMEELKEKVEGPPGLAAPAAEKEVPIPAASPGTFHVWNASEGDAGSLEEEEAEDPGETDISEQLSGVSGEASSRKEATLDSRAYSEDFESCLSSAAAEETEQPSSSSEAPGGPRDSSPLPGHSGFSSSRSWKPQKISKDASVQTSFPSFAHQAGVTFVGLAPEGPTTTGALPTIGRFLSPAVLEGMTTYSPATAALNDLARQNLLLIRQFAETSRRLHASVVASLEEEKFHYHTLEEARRYISRYKPPPLTLDQAMKELEEEGQDRTG